MAKSKKREQRRPPERAGTTTAQRDARKQTIKRLRKKGATGHG